MDALLLPAGAPSRIDLHDPLMTNWKYLTRIPLKAKLYDREPYFREALSELEEALGAATIDVLHRGALLMIKPDGLIGGHAIRIVNFLQEHGFKIVAVRGLLLSRLQWRELWRYQLTASTLDRLMVNDVVFSNPCLLLGLYDVTESDIPATVRLSVLKGPSDVSQQPPDCLRRLMAQPNRVFSLFHVADEPADLMRELSIFLDAADRTKVFKALGGAELSEAERRILEDAVAESQRSIRSLNAVEALKRLREAFAKKAGALADAERIVIADALGAMSDGKRIAWRPFAHALSRSGLTLDPWDIAILGASYIIYDDPGANKQIIAAGQASWGGRSIQSSTC
jgi:nucleoside diphosphate kinase